MRSRQRFRICTGEPKSSLLMYYQLLFDNEILGIGSPTVTRSLGKLRKAGPKPGSRPSDIYNFLT